MVAQLEVEEGEDVGAFDGDGAVGVDGAELLGDVGGGVKCRTGAAWWRRVTRSQEDR